MHIKLKKRDFLRFYERLYFMPKKRVSKTIKPYVLKNGQTRYKFAIRVDDKHTTTKRGFYTPNEAEIAYINLREEILNNDFDRHGGHIKFQEIYEAWLSSYMNTVKPTTFYKTKKVFELHIIPFFGEKYIKDIDVNDCQRALDNWVANLIHYKIVCNYTNSVFKEAIRRDYISRNPMDRLSIPKRSNRMDEVEKKRNRKNFYTIEEQERFLKMARKSDYEKYAFFRLIAFTGLRREEILPLKWKDLNGNKIMINKALVFIDNQGYSIQSTKNEDIRNLILDSETVSVLENWKKLQQKKVFLKDQENQYIFYSTTTDDHYSINTPRRWQKVINNAIDLNHNVTLHGFRHTHGTLLLDNNPNLTVKDLQKRLGHKDLSTTMNIYLHATDKSDNKILDALNNLDKKSKKSNDDKDK